MRECADTGMIIQMQDYSIHDGDGVRTIIFFSGCPLRCQWCANPETRTMEKKLFYYPHKCSHCGNCRQACPQGLDPTTMVRPNAACRLCGACTHACFQKALAISGEQVTAAHVVARITRDALFFRFTDGGVTFSGGEPFAQHPFMRTLVNTFFEQGINMWVETCGYFIWEEVEDIIGQLDHVFMDIKHMDSATHKALTGVANERILENAVHVYRTGIPLTLRMPAIRHINMTNENIHATARFIQKHLPKATVELLPYHELGKAKYIAMGREADFVSFETPSKEELAQAYQIFAQYGVTVVEYR